MASIFAHALIPIAARASIGTNIASKRLMLAGIVCSALPDADVIAFAFNVPYGDAFGHRGFTHSIMFAIICSCIASLFAKPLTVTPSAAFILIFISTVSHPVLDSLTNGGLGVAFFWPIDDTRYFLPWQPIEVSPIGVRNFFSARGLAVIKSEFIWVLMPLASVVIAVRLINSRHSHRGI